MSKPVLGLLAGLAAVAALGQARKRGSRDTEQQACRPGLRTSLQASLASAPEGPLPLNKWIELLQSRGVVRQQMETRGMLAWIEAQRKAGRKSLTKAELLAWAKDNPFSVQVVWKGPPLGGKLTAQQLRTQGERERLMREIKPLLLKEGLSSAQADLVMAKPEQHVAKVADGYQVNLLSLPHEGSVFSVAFSPDGKVLAAGGEQEEARLWRVSDGALLATFPHEYIIRSVALSPDGKVLATGGGKEARLRRVSDGALLATFPHKDYVRRVAFSPDGKVLATGSDDRKARLWRVSDGSPLAELSHNDRVTGVAFSPDGKVLATGSYDDRARLWRISDSALLLTLPHAGWVHSIALSPDGKVLAAGGEEGEAILWRVSDGEQLAELTFEGNINSFAFSPDSKVLATGSDYIGARLWRVSDGALLTTLPHEDTVYSVAFSPDGKVLAAGGEDGKARLWRKEAGSSRLASLLFALARTQGTGPKWSEYVVGEPDAYREMLLVLPPVEGRARFTEHSHWDEPDVLAHARISLRGDVLFIDEIQSDWHQGLAGRKRASASDFPGRPDRGEPAVPFASDWERLVLKHLFAHAAETGVDTVALTDAATIGQVVGNPEVLGGFYDKRLLDVFSALVKRLGGSVERVKVEGFRKTFPGFRMTPAVRRAICSGFDLWGKT